MRLVFMGTPAFAVPSLRRLVGSGHEIAAVLTNPDRPRGRGRRPAPPPIAEVARAEGLELWQPESPRQQGLAEGLAALAPDLFAVVAFSILPRRLLEVPRLGSINLHPSLLPAYRGAAPIPWALINGEQETGLSTFLLNARMDAGDILLQRRVPIHCEETAGELEARLAEAGALLLEQSIDGLERGDLEPRPQNPQQATRAPKLGKEDGRLDWHRPAEELRNRIRGTNPWPGAFTLWREAPLKVHRARLVPGRGEPGAVLSADARTGLVVACGEGALELVCVQPAGRAAMEGRAFVRGYPMAAGERLGAPG